MARYIDVEPLEDKLKEHIKKTESELMLGALSTFLRVLDITPTADAVPVTRCKDCRYYQDNNGGYPNADCKWCKDETPDANDYCSCGERNEKAKGEY